LSLRCRWKERRYAWKEGDQKLQFYTTSTQQPKKERKDEMFINME